MKKTAFNNKYCPKAKVRKQICNFFHLLHTCLVEWLGPTNCPRYSGVPNKRAARLLILGSFSLTSLLLGSTLVSLIIVQDGINVQAGKILKIDKRAGWNKAVQDGIRPCRMEYFIFH